MEIVLVTGQSGTKVHECLELLNSRSDRDRTILSIDKKIGSKIPYLSFLASPQRIQHRVWTEVFRETLNEINNLSRRRQPDTLFLNFHASYYHQKKRELFPAINFHSLFQLRGRVKMVIVLIDDVFDVYRRLMAPNQMFYDVLETDQNDKPKMDSATAMIKSVFNIVSLLNWRETEISVSRCLAYLLDARFFVISTKHPVFMINRLIDMPFSRLKIYYLCHPITAIREDRTQFHSFPGQLELVIKDWIQGDGSDNNVLFFPTSIDELIIRQEIGEGETLFYPELTARWPHPYPDDFIAPPLPDDLKRINPLNPLNYPFGKNKAKDLAESRLLSFLWDYLYEKQIISRDYSLVEQSAGGVVAIRPYFKGNLSLGMEGEIDYNFELMRSEPSRRFLVFSTPQDNNRWQITTLFNKMPLYLRATQTDEFLKSAKENWLRSNRDMNALTSPAGLRNILERQILSKSYSVNPEAVGPPLSGKWKLEKLAEAEQGKERAFQRLYDDVKGCDGILLKARHLRKRGEYIVIGEDRLWREIRRQIGRLKNKQEKGK